MSCKVNLLKEIGIKIQIRILVNFLLSCSFHCTRKVFTMISLYVSVFVLVVFKHNNLYQLFSYFNIVCITCLEKHHCSIACSHNTFVSLGKCLSLHVSYLCTNKKFLVSTNQLFYFLYKYQSLYIFKVERSEDLCWYNSMDAMYLSPIRLSGFCPYIRNLSSFSCKS